MWGSLHVTKDTTCGLLVPRADFGYTKHAAQAAMLGLLHSAVYHPTVHILNQSRTQGYSIRGMSALCDSAR